MRSNRLNMALGIAVLLATAGIAAADYGLDWWTIDAGGEMWTTGGDYELSGTIGQPDPGVMSGGTYSLSGGFWGGVPPYALGDLNCDGQVTGLDIDAFVLALTDVDAYNATYPDCDFMLADCNQDGMVTGLDVDAFVALLIGP